MFQNKITYFSPVLKKFKRVYITFMKFSPVTLKRSVVSILGDHPTCRLFYDFLLFVSQFNTSQETDRND